MTQDRAKGEMSNAMCMVALHQAPFTFLPAHTQHEALISHTSTYANEESR